MLIGVKTSAYLLAIWRDSVWSKVISAGIIAGLALLGAKLANYSWPDIYHFILAALSFQLPLYLYLAVFGLYFIFQKSIQLFQKKKDPFWDVPIGHFTFKELYNILLTTYLPVSTRSMKIAGQAPTSDHFLTLFRAYYSYFNRGVTIEDRIDDGGYLYAFFAPQMVGYGLVEVYQRPDSNLSDVTDTAYKTSALGHQFHACLEKVILSDRLKTLKKAATKPKTRKENS